MDPELLPGSGSGNRKIQSWIRNKSFRIHQHWQQVYLNLPAVAGGRAVHPHRGVQDREHRGQLLVKESNSKK